MTDNTTLIEPEEAGLRRALQIAADLPVPPDLPRRVLDRPRLQGTRSARVRRPIGPPVRRTWAVAGAAASVAAVVLGVAVFGGTAQPGAPTGGATGIAQPAAASNSTASNSTVSDGRSVGAVGPAETTGGTTTTTPTSPVLLPRGNYQAWSTQTVPCAGIPAVADASQQLLRPGVAVATAVVCDTAEKVRPGDGVWLMAGERDLTATRTAALTAALTAADVPVDPAGVCDAMGVLVPDFALVLADGRTVRPGVPGDGCHPSRDVAAILAPVGDSQISATTPIKQLRSQAMVDAGCDPAPTPYWDPFSSGGTGSVGARPKAPEAGAVCRYNVTGDSPENRTAVLAALGTPSAAELAKALQPVLTAQVKPAKACTSPEGAFVPAEGGWLTVVTPAGDDPNVTSSAAVVLSVELGGCHRVLASDGVGWFAPQRAVDALQALATDPVLLR
jgi:hypothetical protein